MDDEMRSAAAPRWRGKAGRLEVWYATLSDPLTRAGLWIHCETVAPVGGPAYAHGWATWFAPDGPPRTERVCPGPRPRAWGVSGKAAGTPLWTFPRAAWERELLPGAQVVIAPTAEFTGSLTVADTAVGIDGWRGGVAHSSRLANAKRWGWIHADLGDGDTVEVVTAVSHKPGLRRLAPMAFVRF